MLRKKVSVNNLATLSGHKDSVYALTGDDKGNIYSSGGDGMVVVWDLSKPKDGKLLAKVESSVYALHVDTEGLLLIGNNYNGLNVIDLDTSKELFSVELQNCGAIYSIVSDANVIYCACQKGVLFTIDKKSKAVSRFQLSTASLRCIQIVEEGFLLSDSTGTLLYLNEKLEMVSTIKDSEKSIFSFFQNKKQLITVSRDAHIRFYKEGEIENDLVGHIYAINDVSINPQQNYFATASQDKTIKIWDLEDQKLLKVLDESRFNGHQNSVNKLFWSSYSNLLVSCSDDRTVKVWDLKIDIVE